MRIRLVDRGDLMIEGVLPENTTLDRLVVAMEGHQWRLETEDGAIATFRGVERPAAAPPDDAEDE